MLCVLKPDKYLSPLYQQDCWIQPECYCVDCVQVGDLIVVDGGMVSLEVMSKAGPDVVAKCVDPGIILSRANLTFKRDGQAVRARNAMLPVLSSKVRTTAPLSCKEARGTSQFQGGLHMIFTLQATMLV